MNKRVIGVLILLLFGGLLLLGGKYLLSYLEEKNQRTTSDAAKTKGRLKIATDSWIGYYPLCSRKMKDEMHRAGWLLECVDDQADYRGRMAALADGTYEFAVATVDSYLLNGEAHNYPGAIVAVLDESKGGDAIVARKERLANLDALRSRSDIRVAFTPDSPSHFLLKATADHFDLPALLPTRASDRLETEGSQKALAKLLAGTTDVAVLWEPDVSKALAAPGVVKLLGTEETKRLIVDILLANRKFMRRNPDVVTLLLGSYFKVLKIYRDSPEILQKEVVRATGLGTDAVRAMLKGVLWASLTENSEQWFGISAPGTRAREQLSHAIYSTADILVNSGDFKRSPIPDNDSYRLIKRSFLETLYTQGIHGFTKPSDAFGGKMQTGAGPVAFGRLNADGWRKLKEVGTLRLKPIAFRSGAAELDMLAKLELDEAVSKLSHYPRFRIVIKGHTGTRGDARQNQILSQQRSDSVAQYLQTQHTLQKNRMHAVGHGSSLPLKKTKGESERAYQRRLLRVELVLVREEI